MTEHRIYDVYKDLRMWNYMTCEKNEAGRETWRINVEIKRGEEVLIPVVPGTETYVDRGYAQIAGKALGMKLVDEAGIS
jgi:hypothetical protein